MEHVYKDLEKLHLIVAIYFEDRRINIAIKNQFNALVLAGIAIKEQGGDYNSHTLYPLTQNYLHSPRMSFVNGQAVFILWSNSDATIHLFLV